MALCECGCGQETVTYFRKVRRYVHGHHNKKTQNTYTIVDGCWIWEGAVTANKRYGTLYVQGKLRRAHIVYYENKYGLIPDGLELDHFYCDNSLCVNPDHLRPVTHIENVRRKKSNKLSPEKVRQFRLEMHTLTNQQLAEKYGIALSYVKDIKSFRAWKNI